MLALHIFNVGQGDSILVEFPDGNWGVVDCNNHSETQVPPALAYLRSQKVERLAFVCLTHPHADHYSGLPVILQEYGDNIDELWIFRLDSMHWREFLLVQHQTATTPSKKIQYDSLQAIFKEMAVKLKKGRVRLLDANKQLLNFGGVEIDCIAPHPREVGSYLSSLARWAAHPTDYKAAENKLSAVLRLKYGDSTVILGSDASTNSWADIERDVRKRNQTLLSNLVKVSHHGSTEGFSKTAWEQIVKPQFTHGAISAGSGYGHPHREVIIGLHKLGVRIHCTNYAPHCLQQEKLDFSRFEGIDPALK